MPKCVTILIHLGTNHALIRLTMSVATSKLTVHVCFKIDSKLSQALLLVTFAAIFISPSGQSLGVWSMYINYTLG